ncbi:unnamed protein product [Lota lota]
MNATRQLMDSMDKSSLPAARTSGMDFLLVNRSETALVHAADNGTFHRVSSPTGAATSTSVAAAEAAAAAVDLPRRPAGSDVYVYVWIFLSLLAFLLTLLVISLHRLKNIITSSSSVPDCSSGGGGDGDGGGGGSSSSDRTSSFTNMEICSISSQKSTVSTLSN